MSNGAPDIIKLGLIKQGIVKGMPELSQTIDYINDNSALIPGVGELFDNNEKMSDGLSTVMMKHKKVSGEMFKQVFENPDIAQNLDTALTNAQTKISDLPIKDQEVAYEKLFQSFIETPKGDVMSKGQMKEKLVAFTADTNSYTNEVAATEFVAIEKEGMEEIAEAFKDIKDSVVNNKDLPMAYRESFHNVFNNIENSGGLFMNEEFLASLKEFAMDNAKAFMGRMSSALKSGIEPAATERTSLALQSGGGPAAELLAKISPDLQIANVMDSGNIITMSAAEIAGIDPSIENKQSRPNNDYTQAPDVPTIDTGMIS